MFDRYFLHCSIPWSRRNLHNVTKLMCDKPDSVCSSGSSTLILWMGEPLAGWPCQTIHSILQMLQNLAKMQISHQVKWSDRCLPNNYSRAVIGRYFCLLVHVQKQINDVMGAFYLWTRSKSKRLSACLIIHPISFQINESIFTAYEEEETLSLVERTGMYFMLIKNKSLIMMSPSLSTMQIRIMVVFPS